MGYIIIFFIILTYSSMLTIVLKKRIEEIIPISIVEIILIIYLFGIFDKLQLGVKIVQIATIIQLIAILMILLLKKDKEEIKKIVKRIITPGLFVYVILFISSIFINKGRIFENYDEFNHWAVIIKNMFLYNTYGTNPESVVAFNEYPPFTAVFQYLFLSIHKIYREDIIIVAQNILYLSIIIPITKCIEWNKSLKRLIIIVPIIVFVPMIFYENFYLDILVDGILGIMFAYVIYSAFQNEESGFKYLKIFVGEIMLCLTKTSGIGLAVLPVFIILIKLIIEKNRNNKEVLKEIKYLMMIILITVFLTSIWYIKVDGTQKRWNFSQYIEVEEQMTETQENISKNFAYATVFKQIITERNFTVLTTFLLLICLQIYTSSKVREENYKYYSLAMALSVPIYLIGLFITYSKIFDIQEARMLTSFERYTSTILLAYAMFQMMVFSRIKYDKDLKNIIVTLSIVFALIPMANIQEKYLDGKNYIMTSNINRNIYTKIKRYKDIFESADKILYIYGSKMNMEYLKAINEYEMMPIRIEQMLTGSFIDQKSFEDIVKDYTYVYIYRIDEEEISKIEGAFQYNYVEKDMLYKVNKHDDEILLEIVKK